jgi:predicted ribosome quality control (RQC) complex YloA/Tae2 family protein
VGGRLETADCPPADRVVEFVFRTREETLRVALEATGRRGNLAVVDADGRVRAAWRWEPAETHPFRSLVPGGPYAPPPARPERPAPATTAPDGPGSLREAGRWLAETAAQERADAETVDREARLRRERRRLEVRAEKIRGDLARLPEPGDLRRQADALAAGLSLARKGDREAWVPDPFDPAATLVIALDAGRSPGENLNRLYEGARRAERARQILEARLEATLAEIEAGGEHGAPAGGRDERGRLGEEGSFRRFRAANGWPLWVGRNGRENDRLLREARPWDLWFHARESPGAHVLLRLPGKEAKVPEAAVIEAAGLAAFYSRRSGEALVDVVVVEAGRVRKPRGASPGRVLVSGERTVRVRPRAGGDGTVAGDRRGRKG